jgi:hypothetical protein
MKPVFSNDSGDRKRHPSLNLLTGVFFSCLLTFFGFFVLRATELALCLALAPFVIGPLIWPLAFYLSTDMRSRVRQILFVVLMAAHYIGLAYALCLEEAYEWGAYRGVFLYAFPQVLIYLWGQFILWMRFNRDLRDEAVKKPPYGSG